MLDLYSLTHQGGRLLIYGQSPHPSWRNCLVCNFIYNHCVLEGLTLSNSLASVSRAARVSKSSSAFSAFEVIAHQEKAQALEELAGKKVSNVCDKNLILHETRSCFVRGEAATTARYGLSLIAALALIAGDCQAPSKVLYTLHE